MSVLLLNTEETLKIYQQYRGVTNDIYYLQEVR